MNKMPAIVVEKPKISRPMWNALKAHIIRERQRKKQEQEADAEVERQRREREDQQKEQEMTLEETKEQVAQSEQRLSQLKEDKHQLFLQLKKVLNEDDTRRKIKESNFNDMMLLHGYPQGVSLGVPVSHGSTMYSQNLGPPRPPFKGVKEEAVITGQSGHTPPTLYGQSVSMVPSMGYQGQPNPKRSRSPSPPPQLYHTYKPHALSPYNTKNVGGNPYGGSPALPGSIFYTHSASVSAAHSAAGSYQLPPGAMYTYPPSHSTSSRSSYSVPNPSAPKDDGPSAPKHSASIFTGQGNSSASQIPPRNHLPRSTGPPMTQGYHHQPMDHLMSKAPSNYGSSEQEKFYLLSHGPSPPGSSSNSGSTSTSGGHRSHGGLVTPIPVLGTSHPSGIPIHQSSHGKGGSITSGHPIQHSQRTAPLPNTSHGQGPRLVYTSSAGGQPQQPPHGTHPSRYYGNPN